MNANNRYSPNNINILVPQVNENSSNFENLPTELIYKISYLNKKDLKNLQKVDKIIYTKCKVINFILYLEDFYEKVNIWEKFIIKKLPANYDNYLYQNQAFFKDNPLIIEYDEVVKKFYNKVKQWRTTAETQLDEKKINITPLKNFKTDKLFNIRKYFIEEFFDGSYPDKDIKLVHELKTHIKNILLKQNECLTFKETKKLYEKLKYLNLCLISKFSSRRREFLWKIIVILMDNDLKKHLNNNFIRHLKKSHFIIKSFYHISYVNDYKTLSEYIKVKKHIPEKFYNCIIKKINDFKFKEKDNNNIIINNDKIKKHKIKIEKDLKHIAKFAGKANYKLFSLGDSKIKFLHPEITLTLYLLSMLIENTSSTSKKCIKLFKQSVQKIDDATLNNIKNNTEEYLMFKDSFKKILNCLDLNHLPNQTLKEIEKKHKISHIIHILNEALNIETEASNIETNIIIKPQFTRVFLLILFILFELFFIYPFFKKEIRILNPKY